MLFWALLFIDLVDDGTDLDAPGRLNSDRIIPATIVPQHGQIH
jgi:hypothetical protein